MNISPEEKQKRMEIVKKEKEVIQKLNDLTGMKKQVCNYKDLDLEIKRQGVILKLTERAMGVASGKGSEHFKAQKERVIAKISELCKQISAVKPTKAKRKKKTVDRRRKRK